MAKSAAAGEQMMKMLARISRPRPRNSRKREGAESELSYFTHSRPRQRPPPSELARAPADFWPFSRHAHPETRAPRPDDDLFLGPVPAAVPSDCQALAGVGGAARKLQFAPPAHCWRRPPSGLGRPERFAPITGPAGGRRTSCARLCKWTDTVGLEGGAPVPPGRRLARDPAAGGPVHKWRHLGPLRGAAHEAAAGRPQINLHTLIRFRWGSRPSAPTSRSRKLTRDRKHCDTQNTFCPLNRGTKRRAIRRSRPEALVSLGEKRKKPRVKVL